MLSNIFLYLVIAIGGFCGVASCLYMVVSLFAVIGFKIFRKCRYGISLFD